MLLSVTLLCNGENFRSSMIFSMMKREAFSILLTTRVLVFNLASSMRFLHSPMRQVRCLKDSI